MPDIAIVGGGPAGLYFAYLVKRREKAARVRLFERNPRDVTWGFGVVFSDRALEFLIADDEDTYRYLVPHMESWPDLKIVHRGQAVPIDGNGFAAVGRLKLLRLLAARAEDVGVEISFAADLASTDGLQGADLIVGADGASSMVRAERAGAFGASQRMLENPFIWYGTSQVFDSLSLTFRANADGVFCAHHYRYAPERSTFIVETDAATFAAAGFDAMDGAATQAYMQELFAPDLGGHGLLTNNSHWRRFPAIANARWHVGKRVLLGDALRTAHFSIGSGTRLAMEDAIALDKALAQHSSDLPAALAAFEAARRPVVEKIAAAAILSARWYEDMANTMALNPLDFAHAYMMRTGRLSDHRLRQIAPRFMALYDKR